MSSFSQPISTTTSDSPSFPAGASGPKIPKSLMSTSRIEVEKTQLQVTDGNIPMDLSGHAFMLSPVGFGNDPYGNGSPIFNGDGMIHRFDFDQPGSVWFKSKRVKTPCYYADAASQENPDFRDLKFHSLGFGRFSFLLGLRNEANTAFLPFQTQRDPHERLLVTYDAGRPFEIDPDSLAVVTAVGANPEWGIETPIRFMFSPVLSTAHPWFDAKTQEIFTVNYGRSIANLISAIPCVKFLEKALGPLLVPVFGAVKHLLTCLWDEKTIQARVDGWVRNADPKATGNYVYLVRWDGHGALERWKLVLPNGESVIIDQTMHQIGVTQDYILLADTAFSFGLEQILNNPFPESPEFEKLLRSFLASRQNPISALYVVKRRDLTEGQFLHLGGKEVTVTAQPLSLPLELVHFVVDYDNPDGQITLHAAHNCASDVSEWLRSFDLTADLPHEQILSDLQGLVGSQMDINRVGRYRIDGTSGKILNARVVYDQRLTWGVGLYTFNDGNVIHQPQGQIKQMYWQSFGFWPETLTEFIFKQYKDYRYRAIVVNQLLDPQLHRPSCLFRVDTEQMAIADSYQFPLRSAEEEDWDGHICGSPQFIPRRDGSNHQTDGYILCSVVSEQAKEVWIFDAANLAQGPLCCLMHPQLDFGFTLHTTWLSHVHPRTSTYKVKVEQDYQPLLDRLPGAIKPLIQKLFNEQIYPHFR